MQSKCWFEVLLIFFATIGSTSYFKHMMLVEKCGVGIGPFDTYDHKGKGLPFTALGYGQRTHVSVLVW